MQNQSTLKGGRVIFSADDFGYSSDINKAVIEAYRYGVLTSASLMVTGDAVQEAVELAWQNPGLAVGIHIVLTSVRPALPPDKIPLLVTGKGTFLNNPVKMGFRLFFNRQAQLQLAEELEAQFKKFLSFNLPLNGIDGHLHLHHHPTVQQLLIPLAIRFGATGFRLVNENFTELIRNNSRGLMGKLLMSAVFRALANRSALKKVGLIVSDHTYGFSRSGEMSEEYVISILKKIKKGVVEFYFHPSFSPHAVSRGANRGDLDTLLSNSLRRVLFDRHLHTISYRDLRQ